MVDQQGADNYRYGVPRYAWRSNMGVLPGLIQPEKKRKIYEIYPGLRVPKYYSLNSKGHIKCQCNNPLDRKRILIGIEGNISSGKTTICEEIVKSLRLSEDVVTKVITEPVDVWQNLSPIRGGTYDLLNTFYNNKTKYSFSFQITALQTRCKKIRDAIREIPKDKHAVIFIERTPFTDMCVFAALLYEEGFITDIEMGIYELFFGDYIEEFKVSVHAIIHLNCNGPIALNRIKKRGRPGEQEITTEYLNAISLKEKQMVDRMKNIGNVPILVIDSNDITDVSFNIGAKMGQINEFIKELLSKHHLKNNLPSCWKSLVPVNPNKEALNVIGTK
jgi:deoxyadenosine/deoxycytidine kinase